LARYILTINTLTGSSTPRKGAGFDFSYLSQSHDGPTPSQTGGVALHSRESQTWVKPPYGLTGLIDRFDRVKPEKEV
jgi:hypothetical protein